MMHGTATLAAAGMPNSGVLARTRIAVVCGLCALLGLAVTPLAAPMRQAINAAFATSASVPSASRTTTLPRAPDALRTAVEKDLGAQVQVVPHQLGATYGPAGAHLVAAGTGFTVGLARAGRPGASLSAVSARVTHFTDAATYGRKDFSESFAPVATGIEQSFTIVSRSSGSGPLLLSVPLTGVLAKGSGSSITVENSRTHADIASYGGLRVTDAVGDFVRATMTAGNGGRTINISIRDAMAIYPLKVDPTWIEAEEFTSADNTTQSFGGLQTSDSGCGCTYIGTTIAITGTYAFFAASDIIGGIRQGVVYAFIENPSGLWVQQAELQASDASSGSDFGGAVAVSGSTLVIGDPLKTVGSNANQGEVYVFGQSGSGQTANWTQKVEFTSSDGASGDLFGVSIAVSGSTIAVGSRAKTVGGQSSEGEAYVFTGSGSLWTQTAILTSSDGAAGDWFGAAIAISSGAVIVGAELKNVSAGGRGAVYMYNASSYTQSAEFTAASFVVYLGGAIAASGNEVVAGADNSNATGTNSGAVVVYTESGTTWSQATILGPPNGGGSQFFGESVSLSGTTLSVASGGLYGQHGIAWMMAGGGSSWTGVKVADPADRYNYDGYGSATATNGLVAFFDDNQHQVGNNAYQGVVYDYSPNLVNPNGVAMVNIELAGGGSPSDPALNCPWQTGAGVPTVHQCGDPVDTATGDFSESATDLTLPGAGMPLQFSRTYDAQAAQAEVTAGAPAGPLGYGWTDNFAMSLAYNSSTQVATVTEENGAQTTYSAYVSGTSPAWCSGSTNYCARAPRTEAALNHNTDGTWTFTREVGNPETFSFSSAGALAKITDSGGDSLTSSSYSPGSGQTACPSGDTCTAWSSSASGREMVLATNASGQLVEVFDANSNLAATFAFSGTGCTSWGAGQTADLCTVTNPGSIVSTYTYDSGNPNADFVYDVLTATPAGASGQTTNTYNNSGQVTQQSDPAGQVTTYSYAGTNSSVAGGTTTVTTFPDGTGTGEPQDVTVDTYSSNTLSAETTGYGASDAQTTTIFRDPNSLLPTIVMDGNGHATANTYQNNTGNVLTKTDAAGNTTAYAYTSTNQPWCTVKPANYANGTRCPSTEPSSPPGPGATDPNLGATINFYNAVGLLTATTDALGNTSTFSYTSGVSGVPNNLLYCAVDPVNYQASVTCPAYGAAHVAGTTTSTYDAAGDKLTSTDALGHTTTNVYGDASTHPGLVSQLTDPDGDVTSYTYNGAGEVTNETASFGTFTSTTLKAYDAHGRVYCKVDPIEATKGVTCPASPPSPSSPPANLTSTFYDADGHVTQSTNALGGTSITAYDGTGAVYCTVSPANYAAGTRCPSSSPTTQPTPSSDPYAGAVITGRDALGQVTQTTNTLGGIELSAYDPAGNVLTTTTESNNTTSAPNVVTAYTYDADNRVATKTVGSGGTQPETTAYGYDPNSKVFCTVSPKAYAAGSSTYQCPPWTASWIASPPNPSSLYSTTPNSSQADDVTTDFYNADAKLVQSTDADVHTSIAVFNAAGQPYCTADATNVGAYLSAHSGATYPYDCPSTPPTTPPANGSNPGYALTVYDAAGHKLDVSDLDGNTTTYTYDALGQVLTTTDPRSKVTTNCYLDENASGQCANGAPSNSGWGSSLYRTTTPATSADPLGEVTTYAYGPDGQALNKVTPSGTDTFGYDAAGDVLRSTWSGVGSGYATPATVTDTYNTDATVHTQADATGTTTFAYDANADLTSEALVATGSLANQTTGYTYFDTGVKATTVYPSYSGHTNPTVSYAYDQDGQMASATDWLGNKTTFAHDADNNPTVQDNNQSSTNPNGTSNVTASFDNADNATGSYTSACTSLSTKTGSSGVATLNADAQVTSDPVANASSCATPTSRTNGFSYDANGQVVWQGAGSQGANPNNVAFDASADPTTFSNDTAGTTDTYTQAFDAAGEVTSQTPNAGSGGSTTNYTYDTLGDRVSASGGYTSTSTYNAAGQLASSTSGGSTTSYTENGAGLEAATSKTIVNPSAWQSPAVIDSGHALKAVACPSATFCAAVDGSGFATTWNGTAWSTPSDVDASRALDAVSCASASFCVAVDTSGFAVIWNGTSWGTATDIDSTRNIDTVDCVSSTFCVAGDATGYAVVYSGSWHAPTDVNGSRGVTALSCTSSTFCEAVGAAYAAKYTGTWATAAKIDGNKTLSALSCATSTFCEAVDTAGDALAYTGSWGLPSSVDGSRSITTVTCLSSSFCMAVDASGFALKYSGTWGTPVDADGSRNVDALSCSSSTWCAAADTTGFATTYNGTTWTTATDVDTTHSIAALSCVSSSFCAAVDGSGNGVMYEQTTSTSTTQLTWDPTTSLPTVLSDLVNDYVYAAGTTPIEQVSLSSSTPTWLDYDKVGEDWTSVNAAGTVTGFWAYDAFGNLLTGTPQSAFGYSGQYIDSASGLVNDRARLYSATTGGFTTRDPAFATTDTAYTYAGGDPVNGGDPSGLCSRSNDGALLFNGPCPWAQKGLTDAQYMLRVHSAIAQVQAYYAPPGYWSQVGNNFVDAGEGFVGRGPTRCSAVAGIESGLGKAEQFAVSALATDGVLTLAGRGAEYIQSLRALQAVQYASDTGVGAGRVFWTGGDAAMSAATKFALDNGGETIGMTPLGQVAEQATEGLPYRLARPAWEAASARFTQGASGEVHVFINVELANSGSIWAQTELPGLVQNTNVTDVIFHLIGGG